jgi:hypothetical protein
MLLLSWVSEDIFVYFCAPDALLIIREAGSSPEYTAFSEGFVAVRVFLEMEYRSAPRCEKRVNISEGGTLTCPW